MICKCNLKWVVHIAGPSYNLKKKICSVKIHLWLYKTLNLATISTGLGRRFITFLYFLLGCFIFAPLFHVVFPVQCSEWMICDIIWTLGKHDDLWTRMCVWYPEFLCCDASFHLILWVIWASEKTVSKAALVCEREVNANMCPLAKLQVWNQLAIPVLKNLFH